MNKGPSMGLTKGYRSKLLLAFELLNGGKVTLSTQLIILNYLRRKA